LLKDWSRYKNDWKEQELMSDNNQNNPKQECKCLGAKELKALKKQYDELFGKIEQLERQVATLRKAVRK
jgi:hypothetical protein